MRIEELKEKLEEAYQQSSEAIDSFDKEDMAQAYIDMLAINSTLLAMLDDITPVAQDIAQLRSHLD